MNSLLGYNLNGIRFIGLILLWIGFLYSLTFGVNCLIGFISFIMIGFVMFWFLDRVERRKKGERK